MQPIQQGSKRWERVHLPSPAVGIGGWSWRVVILAAGAGALGAFAAALVRLCFRGLQWILTGSSTDPPEAAAALHLGRRWLTPVLGAGLASLVTWLGKRRARRQGRPIEPFVEYVEAVRHKDGRVPLVPNLWRTGAAACSVASGAAVGREGSMIQFAAAVCSAAAQRWKPQAEQNGRELAFLVACGVAGGVTAAYNAPLASVFFASEIVLGGAFLADLPLLGCAVAAAWAVSAALLGKARLYPAPVTLHINTLWTLPLLAVAAGVLGPVYQWLLQLLRPLRRLPLPLLWSGLVVGGLSCLDPRVWGNGDVGLRTALLIGRPDAPQSALALARVLALRLGATLVCVWTGTIGGVFTPTLFTGGAMGALCAHGAASGDAVRLFAIVGMGALMSAVTHAPLMAACMAVELTGNWQLLPVLVPLNYLSWGIARKLSPRAMYAIASQAPDAGQGAGQALRTDKLPH